MFYRLIYNNTIHVLDLPIRLQVPRPSTNCIFPIHDKPSSQNGPTILLQRSPSFDLIPDVLYKCGPKYIIIKTPGNHGKIYLNLI